eukprot:c14449_g1_i1 orf=647-1174(-)
MAMAQLAVTPSLFISHPQQRMVPGSVLRRPCTLIHCSVSSRFAGSPKTGTVGTERLKEGALPGTYWSSNAELGEEIRVAFNKGSETVTAVARVGENLLRVAERCEVMIPNQDFCFEGSCCHCEMEVVGGASEVGPNGSQKLDELVRSCICPVPFKNGGVQVNLINEDDVWGERVL